MLPLLPGKSIKTQLTALIFGLTASVILLFGFLAIQGIIESGKRAGDISSDSMTKRVEQFLVETTTATADKNSIIFHNVQRDTTNVAQYTEKLLDQTEFATPNWRYDQRMKRLSSGQYSNDLNELSVVLVQPFTKVTPFMKYVLERTSYLDALAPQLITKESNAVAVYFIGLDGYTRYYPSFDLASITAPDFNPSEQEFSTVANPKNNPTKVTKWTSVYDDPAGNGLMITAVHPVYSRKTTFVGTIGIDVLLNKIASNIEDYSPIESSYAFLVDNKGRAIALPQQGYQDILGRAAKKGEFGSDLTKVTGDFATILTKMRKGEKGFTQAQIGKRQLYISYAPVEATGFSLGIVAEQAVVLKVVTDLQQQVTSSTQFTIFLLVVGGSVLMSLIWSIGLSYIRKLSEPINHLNSQMVLVASGNFAIEPTPVHLDNEIGQLATSFGHMVTDLRDSRRKIEEQNKELLQTEQSRLAASINSLNIGYILTGGDNEIILINGIAKQMLNVSDPDAPATHTTPLKDSWTIEEIDATLRKTISFKTDLDNTLHSGQRIEHKEIDFRGRILRIFMAPIKGPNQTLGVVVLIEDITEVKMLERAKDEFFSIASHELRTPLTAIRGNTSMIEQLYRDQIHDKNFDEMLADIHEASVRLIGIVNDFLDASRLEQGRITFENAPLSLGDTIKVIVDEFQTVAKEKGNEIIIAGDLSQLPPVFADKNRVKQIIYNLLGNANKFTEHGTITIDAKQNDAFVQIFINDTGPGITLENQRLLFHKFNQIGGNSFTYGSARGTGLGLYISKLLCEQMGGKIALELSEVGKGTTFSFSLPLKEK